MSPVTSSWPVRPAGRIALLDVDPDLCGGLSRSDAAALHSRLTVPVHRVAVGRLPEPPARHTPDDLGFIVLKGLLLYEVEVCKRITAEILGPGDLVRPWSSDATATLASTACWSALTPTLLADLGRLAAPGVSSLPEIVETLVTRTAERAEALAIQRSISAHVRVDVRVLAYLWHLADRFGVVLPDAVRLDLPLTHAVLARLVGARRPTVTTALQRLMELGYVGREGRSFVLRGGPESVGALEAQSPSKAEQRPSSVALR